MAGTFASCEGRGGGGGGGARCGGYHFPSDASHHPGPCDVSLIHVLPPLTCRARCRSVTSRQPLCQRNRRALRLGSRHRVTFSSRTFHRELPDCCLRCRPRTHAPILGFRHSRGIRLAKRGPIFPPGDPCPGSWSKLVGVADGIMTATSRLSTARRLPPGRTAGALLVPREVDRVGLPGRAIHHGVCRSASVRQIAPDSGYEI